MNKSYKFSFGKTLSFASLLIIAFCVSSSLLKAMEGEEDSPSKKRGGSELESEVSQKKAKQTSSQTDDSGMWQLTRANSLNENWDFDSKDSYPGLYTYDSALQRQPSEELFASNAIINNPVKEDVYLNNNNFQAQPHITHEFYQFHDNDCENFYIPMSAGQSASNTVINNSSQTSSPNFFLGENSNNNSFQTQSHITNDLHPSHNNNNNGGNSHTLLNSQSLYNTALPKNTAQITKKTINDKKIYFSACDLEMQANNKSLHLKDAKIELVEAGQSSAAKQQQDWFVLTFNTESGPRCFKLSEAELMKYVVSENDRKLITDGCNAVMALKTKAQRGEFYLKLFRLIFGSANMVLPQEDRRQLEDFLSPEIDEKKKQKILKKFLAYKKEGKAQKWVNLVKAASDLTVLKEELDHGNLDIRTVEIDVIPKTAHIPEFPHKAADIGYSLYFKTLFETKNFRARESELVNLVTNEFDKNFIINAGKQLAILEGVGYFRRSKLKQILFTIVFKEGALTQDVVNQLQFLWKTYLSDEQKLQALASVDAFIKNPDGNQSVIVTNLPNQNEYLLGQNVSQNQLPSAQAYYSQQMTISQQQQVVYPISNPLNITATEMTQRVNQSVPSQNTAPQHSMEYNWYLMHDLNKLAGKPVENILRKCVTILEPVVCLNDEQLNSLGYHGSFITLNTEKWYIFQTLTSTYIPVDINILKAFVRVGAVAYLNNSQLQWVKNRK